MSTVFGASRHVTHARNALSTELCRTTDYFHSINTASTPNEKLFFMKCLFEYLREHSIFLCQHVGFRLDILKRISDAKDMAKDRRYRSNPYVKPMQLAIADVEKIIQNNPIKNAF